MLLRQLPRGQHVRRVIRQHWHHGLDQGGAMFQLGGHLVHGGAHKLAARIVNLSLAPFLLGRVVDRA
jgi:hypothetical protein